MAVPVGLKDDPQPVPVGSVEGSAYLVPNPADHEYAYIYGVEAELTAKSVGLVAVLNDALYPVPAIDVAGLAYLVPNPADQG
jgi:hypothetical protein